MRILVSGGGTAGHISPILATVDALKSLEADLELLYVGESGGMEARIAQSVGLPFMSIKAGKFRRNANASAFQHLQNVSISLKNLRDLGRISVGVGQSLRILRSFKPDLVFVKGGFVGLPVGIAAIILRVPYVIHESDLTPGLTNKILAKNARKIAVGFPTSYYKQWPASKLVYTGNPIRSDFLKKHRLEGLAHFKLDSSLPVVLITGGSQGARAINTAAVEALRELLKTCQVIHVTGEKEYENVQSDVKKLELGTELSKRYVVRPFLMHDMGFAYAASDVAVGRAGAGTIAELAALAKPAIIIPNYLMAGHQIHNAKVLSRAGAAKVIQEQRLRPEMLVSQVKQILTSDEEQKLLSERIKEFGFTDGAIRLAKVIIGVAPKPKVEPSDE